MTQNSNSINGRYTAKQFIDVIPGSGGIVSTIAARVGCAWHTARKYIDNYPTIKQAYNDECEKVLDAAESVIVGDIIEAKDTQTAKWYLTMKGRQRGYAKTERQEHSGTDGESLTITLNWDEHADDGSDITETP